MGGGGGGGGSWTLVIILHCVHLCRSWGVRFYRYVGPGGGGGFYRYVGPGGGGVVDTSYNPPLCSCM